MRTPTLVGPDVADLLAALPGDLLLLQLSSGWVRERPARVLGGAVAMYHAFGGGEDVVVTGDPGDAYDLVLVAAAADPRPLSAPREVTDRLVAERGWEWHEGWAFRATSVAPALPLDGAAWLGPEDDEEVRGLLTAGFPDASLPVGHPSVRRWAGLRREGRLVACAADATAVEELGFLASIASHPDVRGTGAGTAVTAWATAALVEEHGACGLWHMENNRVASAVYARLGYSDDHRMGVAAPRAEPS